MSFSLNNQVDKLTFKVLAANVIDSNPNSKWYESRFPANPAILAERILNQFDLIKQFPAPNLSTAQSNVSSINALSPGPVIQDLSLATSATRLTRAVAGRKETWVVYNTYNDPNSGFRDLWVQPQRVPRTDSSAPGSPSQGYAVKIWIGDPNGSTNELTTTLGSGDEVGWVFNYDMGILLFSTGMVSFLDTNYPTWETIGLWITGFRYIGAVGGLGNSGGGVSDDSGNFHALGRTKTYTTFRVGNENFKSGHNIRSKEVWIDNIPYAGNANTAYNNVDNVIIRQIGTLSNPAYLYPLSDSNYRTWFFDMGTPSYDSGGFYPSEDWVKNLISPVDVPNDYYIAPSFGYELQMYSRDGSPISYTSAYYDVDYFSGFIFFQEDKTPIDSNNGLGFTFDSILFESSSDKLSYLKNTSTGGPRAIAFQYIGRFLSDLDYGDGLTFSNGQVSINIGTQSGLTFSSGQLQVFTDESTIKINSSGQIYVSGDSVYQTANPLDTTGNGSPTGVLVASTPLNYSTVKVFVNGQIQIIGDGVTNTDCYFFDGVNPVGVDDISSGDELYWNGNIAGYNLNIGDLILILYEV